MRISDWSSDVCSSDLLIVDVLRDRNALYRVAADGSIENAYTLKLINKTQQVQHYRVGLVDEHNHVIDGLRIVGGATEVEAAAQAVVSLAITLSGKIGRASCRERVCQYV